MKIRLNQWAVLVESPPECPAVLFEGRHYGQRELVPPQIRGVIGVRDALSARDFVAMCMNERFGDSNNWPALAQFFALA